MYKISKTDEDLKVVIPDNFSQKINQLMFELCKHSGPVTLSYLRYHQQSGGSQRRAKLCYITAVSLGLNMNTAKLLAVTVELLHNASLIHDDVQDKDRQRRGQDALWVKASVEEAICLGDTLIVAAYHALSKINTPANSHLQATVCRRVMETIRGQMDDLSPQLPLTEQSYTLIATNKAAPLLSLSVELPALLAGEPSLAKALSNAASSFALAYQFYDDLCDQAQDATNQEPNIVNIRIHELAGSLNASDEDIDTAKDDIKNKILILLDQATSSLAPLPTEATVILQQTIKELKTRIEG